MKKQITQPGLSPEQYVGLISKSYSEVGNPERAEQQSAYLRNLFPYYGLKAPEWLAILKEIFNQHGLYDGDLLLDFVRRCQEEECREMHYAGLQMLEKKIKRQPVERIDFLEELALTNSWWDTVDWINKLVGIHLKRYRELQLPIAEKWIESDSRWLQRLAIVHQLTYKERTDWELMQRMILRRADSSEFFVQKAAGWALRQYSKTNGEAVIDFILKEGGGLSVLTNREALKWLKSNNRMK
jgi:3-methyladenine DNA glycosylase AlkD